MNLRIVIAIVASLSFHSNLWASAVVTPVAQTPARLAGVEGHENDPDDPAIWIHPYQRSASLVITTLKEGGMDVYDLNGTLIQHITPNPVPGIAANPARFNNVDIVFGMLIDGRQVDVAVVSDRYNDMIRCFAIELASVDGGREPLVEITAKNQSTIFNDDPAAVAEGDFTTYGLAVSQPRGPQQKVFAFVSQNDTNTLAKLRLVVTADGRVAYKEVGRHDLPEVFTLPDGSLWDAAQDDDDEQSHVEGIVVDDRNGVVYFGQEQVGIWKAPLAKTFVNLELIDKVDEFGVPYLREWDEDEEEYAIELLWDQDKDYGSDYLHEDVEGLTIYDAGNGEGYLIASSQGSDEFVVYDRKSNAYIGNFSIGDNEDAEIDSVQESDGAAVTHLDLGGEFSSGLLVVQDGNNTPAVYDEEGEALDNANFKYIRWEDVAAAMGLTINNQ